MTCSCPKCNSQIEVDLSKVSDSGSFIPCPECKGRFWVNRESYSRMSLKKEGVVYCDQCGKELDHKIVCSSCGVMFPDYYLVQASKPPRRQVEKVNLLTMSFSLKPATPTYTYEYAYEGKKRTAGWAPAFNMRIIGTVAVVLLLAALGGYYYHIKQVEKQFARTYMRTLYSIKIGTDLSLNTCAKISADWKSKGEGSVPRISTDDESRLNQVKDLTDKFMQKLNDTPRKYLGDKERLANLYQIYSKAHSLAIAPSGTVASFEGAAANSRNEFNSAISDLKSNMPSALSEELQLAQKRLKALQNI